MLPDIVTMLGNVDFWAAVLRIATPLILGTLGVLLCERAGVLNPASRASWPRVRSPAGSWCTWGRDCG